MKLQIVSPEREVFNGEVDSVTLPGTAGTFTILPGHAPIVSPLAAGTVAYRVKGAGEEQRFDTAGGFVEQSNNVVTVCAEPAEAEPINKKQ
ncbi:MAG: ATP synthase F1 subunit epsilon [Prevotellaceae bacterium]|nr:ATP synthase F1 subunit epsilon [Prevotellaceae bacterium]